MSEKPIVSIIVPIYGVEKHISKCIKSIQQQTFKNFECLLVNDGTKDNSITIAEKAIADDNRFVILHKDNGGQGTARNLGLEHAKGEYISFVDSDDYVEPDYLQAMYTQIVKTNADICTCNVKLISPTGILIKKFLNQGIKYTESNDLLNSSFFISNWFWDKLYRRQVFEHLRFDPNVRTYEDAHLAFRVYYKKKITQVDFFLYNYVQHIGSTSNGVNPTYVKDRVSVKDKQFEFAKKIGIDDQKYLTHLYLKTFVFTCAAKIARFSMNYSKDIQDLQKNIDDNYFNLKNIMLTIKDDKKTGLSLLLFNFSPLAFRLIVRLWFRGDTA